MTEKRFKLRLSKLGNGMITDTQKREDLYFDKDFLDATLPKVNKWLNEFADESEQLREKLKKYEEIEELKKEDFINCHNCKNDRSVHDGVALDGMCAIKELMNLDGYFDTEYHRLPRGTFCPCWELEE